MKIRNTFLVGLMAMAGLSSCVSEEMKSDQEKAGSGLLVLDVSLLQPENTTRAVTEVTDFQVDVVSEDESYAVHYAHVTDVPASVVLPVGNYTVSSHTDAVKEKRMTIPYYEGAQDFEIKNGIKEDVDVVCKMQNSHIVVNYSEEFLAAFSSWIITIDDSDETGLYFDENSESNEYYWFFEGKTETLDVYIEGVLKSDGSTVKNNYTISKPTDTMEQYGDDAKYYHGGDVIVIKIETLPEEAETGKISGIFINASVTFEEDGNTVDLNVTDADQTGGGGEPGGDDAITLNLPQDMTVSGSTDPALGDTYIKCDNGIKSIKVSIASSSDEMIESLGDLNDNYGVDFVNGAEIVENEDLVTLFEDLGQTLSVPSAGDEEYTFPIGNFFGLLVFLPGEHTFNLVIEDMDGNKKSGVLVLTVE